jgi:NADP-dependent 3-hydroxy acid dehydrogenase YdfG
VDLKNAAARVTGANCGIGFETARLLRERGTRVAICARHKNELEGAAKISKRCQREASDSIEYRKQSTV